MLSSIRVQLVSVLFALIALILAQGYIARDNQTVLNRGIASASQAVVDVALVKELERDVVDLQRNVLIFKENASKSAITRFSRLMVTINAKLDKLNIGGEDGASYQAELLNRMREHLNTYQENFSQVVGARTQKDNLIADGTLSDLTLLSSTVVTAYENKEISKAVFDAAKGALICSKSSPNGPICMSLGRVLQDYQYHYH